MLSVLRASRLFAALAIVASSGPVSAEPLIRITEVMSKAGDDDPTEDWFEITNYGTTAVDLTDWRMDDNSFSWAASVPLLPYTTGPLGNPWGDTFALNPGESAVFLESTTNSPFSTALPAFQTFWNLGPEPDNLRNPKLGSFSGSGVSLSSGGDAVIIFNAAQQEITRTNFGAATTGSSFYWTFDAEGQLATARLGTVSVVGVADAYASTGGLNNTGSPGVAVVAADVEPLYWTGNGTSLGGTGVWDTSLNRWAPALTIGGGIPAGSATTWTNGASAIFDSNTATAGTVMVNADVRPLGVNILKDGYVLAAGSGSIATSSILVTTGTATISARLTGDQTLGISGGGTLVLANPANDYTGLTSVAEGTVRSGASNVIPDVSRLTAARFTTYDFAGFSDTVAGFAGLGTIRTDGVLTVNITDDADRRLDGFLSGTGDLVIDSAGTGRQILNTSAQSLNIDFAVKDYSGATLVRRGTLAINETAQPIGTSGVTIQSGGRLEFTSDAATYQMGPSPATVVTLAGGTLGQEAGEDITLTNAINVTANSTIAVATSKTPDVLNPTIEFVRLTGPLAGAAERTLTLAASNTTSGEDRALVEFASPTGNTFAGTIAASVNMTARFAGDYSAASVTLAGGGLEGAGSVGTVSGLGTVAPGLPDGDLAPGMGILTVSTLSAAGFDYQFEFQNPNTDPFWDTPDFSGNDVLRLTGVEPFGGASLSMANEVRLLLDVSSVAETDTFRGGFFSTGDLSDEIADAIYSVFVRDDVAIAPDLTVSGVNYLSLASWNAANSTDYGAAIAMVAVDALFDGVTTTSGYVMQLALGGDAPPPPGPDYTGGYIVNPTVGDDENIPWGTVLAWAPTGPTEGLTFVPPKVGDSIAVNKLTAGRRNVDLGGAQAVGDIASTVDGNENASGNGGVRFRGGMLTLDTGDGTESLVTYSGTGTGRLEFRFDGLGERLVFANDVQVVADNTAGRVDIRGTVSGSDTLTKAGPGELRFTATFDDTSGGNLFNATGLTGDIVVEQGVLQLGDQVTLPAVASVGVADGGQLRLAGAGTGDTPFTYSLGSSPLTLAGGGRSGVPSESGLGLRGALRYEPASGSRAVLANAVALAADVDIHVSGPENALTLSGGVTGVGGLTKSGGGTLVLAAANGYSGATRIDTGTLEVAHANSLGSSDVTVASGATLAVATGTTMKAPSVTLEGGTLTGSVAVNAATGVRRLAINSGSLSASTAVVVGPGGLVDLPVADRVTVGVASLAVDQSTGGGRVDLGAGELAVAAGGIAAVDLRADILAGRNGGAWNGATGITSSAAAASGGSRAVGYVVAGDGSARVSFAAPGDTGLNGTVDVFDLVSVNSAGRYGTGTAAVWSQGDFNYDGVTNVFDLVSINTAGAYGQGSYFPAAPSAGSLGSPAAVPEPGTLGLVALVAAAALGFQRRMR